jgi:hypothetical protein
VFVVPPIRATYARAFGKGSMELTRDLGHGLV